MRLEQSLQKIRYPVLVNQLRKKKTHAQYQYSLGRCKLKQRYYYMSTKWLDIKKLTTSNVGKDA